MSKKHFLFLCLLFTLSVAVIADEYIQIGDPIALTAPEEFYMTPQWSPTGDQLAASGRSYNNIYLIEFPTGSAYELSSGTSAGYGFAWSHDGNRIAARVAHYNNMRRTNTLVSYDIHDGSLQTHLNERSYLSGRPTWSADDSQLYMSFSDKVASYDLSGQRQASIPMDVVTVEDGKLVYYPAGSKTAIFLSKDQDRVTSYALSPDGEHVAYSTSGQNLWMTNISNQNRIALGKGLSPSWSPDSEWITLMVTEDDGHSMLNSDIFIMRRDASQKTNITNTSDLIEMHPVWSPDGSWIVYDTEFRGQLMMQQIGWR